MRQKAVLIDANSFLYRSYYAISPVDKYRYQRTSAAMYGFTKMLLQVLNKQNPDYIAVAFDIPAPSKRKKKFIEYQAKRPKMPPDLRAQLPHIKNMIGGFNIPVFELDGYDADDILGTIVKKVLNNNFDILIITSFKDALQLTRNENIKILNPHQKNAIYDARLVQNRFGIEPDKFSDFLALVGDDSENIPGVPGVGLKTASELINKYGDINGIMSNLDKIQPKLTQAIRENKDALLTSTKIATIDADVPIEVKLEKLARAKYDYEKLENIFKQFGFMDLLIPMLSHKHKAKADYKCVLDKAAFNKILGSLKACKEFCFDTETTSKDPLSAEIVGISFSFEKDRAYYIPLKHHYQGAPAQLDKKIVLERLKPFFEDSSRLKIGQNLKYDLLILQNCRISARGPFFDTMIASYLLDPSVAGHDLDTLSMKFLNHRMTPFKELVGEKQLISEVDMNLACEYACEDADIALQLKNIFKGLLEQEGLSGFFYDVEMKLLTLLKDMESQGLNIDSNRLKVFYGKFQKALVRLGKQIKKIAGKDFNINSPAQLSKVISEKIKLPKNSKQETSSAGKVALQALARNSAFAAKVLESRRLEKMNSVLIKPFLEHIKQDKIYTSYGQVNSRVGGITSSSPNLYNIPKEGFIGAEIRKSFVPDKGYLFLSFDYSQLHLRLLAHLTKDQELLRCFREKKDIHKLTASYIFKKEENKVNKKERDLAKLITYGLLHGLSAKKISLELEMEHKQVQDYANEYYKRYSGMPPYLDFLLKTARKQKYVSTIMGRKRPLPEISSANRQARALAEHEAMQVSVLGSASDLIKQAIIRINEIIRRENLNAKVALAVDDEIVVEVLEKDADKAREVLKETLENLIKLDVPLEVEVKSGANWSFR